MNMHVTEINLKACEEIIKILHRDEISIEQSYAILDYVKHKIAQDTKVGPLISFAHEEL